MASVVRYRKFKQNKNRNISRRVEDAAPYNGCRKFLLFLCIIKLKFHPVLIDGFELIG